MCATKVGSKLRMNGRNSYITVTEVAKAVAYAKTPRGKSFMITNTEYHELRAYGKNSTYIVEPI